MISYYMIQKYPCNLGKPFKILLTLQNKIKDENVAIKQGWLDEIKWLVYVFYNSFNDLCPLCKYE